MSTTNEKIILHIDASWLKETTCELKALWIQQGWKFEYENFKAEYGTAIHKALRYYYEELTKYNGNPEQSIYNLIKTDSIKIALDYFKPFEKFSGESFYSTLHLESVIQSYFAHYNRETMLVPATTEDNSPVIENKFSVKYFEDDKFIIYLEGTIDLIALFMGQLSIIDHKTTAAKNPVKKLESYKPDIQVKFYTFIVNYIAHCGYLPFIINGIFLQEETKKTLEPAKFIRSEIITFTNEEMDEFQEYLDRKIYMIMELFSGRKPQPEFKECHNGYFPCKFYSICKEGPELRDMYLQSKCINKPYEPLKFQD